MLCLPTGGRLTPVDCGLGLGGFQDDMPAGGESILSFIDCCKDQKRSTRCLTSLTIPFHSIFSSSVCVAGSPLRHLISSLLYIAIYSSLLPSPLPPSLIQYSLKQVSSDAVIYFRRCEDHQRVCQPTKVWWHKKQPVRLKLAPCTDSRWCRSLRSSSDSITGFTLERMTETITSDHLTYYWAAKWTTMIDGKSSSPHVACFVFWLITEQQVRASVWDMMSVVPSSRDICCQTEKLMWQVLQCHCRAPQLCS